VSLIEAEEYVSMMGGSPIQTALFVLCDYDVKNQILTERMRCKMTMSGRCLSIALSLVLAALLAASCTPKEPVANPVVDPIQIDTGYISGTLIGEPGKDVHIYRGIPYAAPPVGDLRWKPPQPPDSWPGIRECTVFGKSSPQPVMPDLADMPQSEDCLYLNVLTPAKNTSDALPVMVWLHGGGYYAGSGSSALFNSFRLPLKGVTLVTVNMRLGPMGLLAHPLLSKESPKGVSGNYMFLDMIAALDWVQRNISAFGGDPKNVTIFGESGGGAKVNCLMASPLAKGLFHKGIFESGAAGGFSPGVPMKDMESIGEKFFAQLGVNKEADPLKAARALPTAKIMEAESSLSKELGKGERTRSPWDAAIDGQFLADTPANIFRAGKQNPAPVITCANQGELTGPGTLVLPFLIPDYVNILKGVNAVGQKGYACIFDQVPSKWRQEGCVSFHAIELAYVFGDWDNASGWWNGLFGLLAKSSGAKTPDPGLTDTDQIVSDNMMAMWTQFARTGNPNVEDLATWPAYDAATDQYLYIAEPLQVKSEFSKVAQKQ
jgi:para-nitrobenzyl esterase